MESADVKPVWIRAKRVAEMFGLSRLKVNKLVAKGLVDARRDGSVVIYKVSDIETAIERLPRYE